MKNWKLESKSLQNEGHPFLFLCENENWDVGRTQKACPCGEEEEMKRKEKKKERKEKKREEKERKRRKTEEKKRKEKMEYSQGPGGSSRC